MSTSRYIGRRLRLAIARRDEYSCQHCGIAGSLNDFHLDHIVPVARDGQTVFNNLQLLCPACNWRKGSRVPDEYPLDQPAA